MARKAMIEKEKRREHLVRIKWEKRKELKAIVRDLGTSEEEKMAAQEKLNKLSKNSSKIRLRNRCRPLEACGHLCEINHMDRQVLGQFARAVRFGMTPAQAIQSATLVSAELLGWEDRVGRIAPGMYADIVAVNGNPLEDISELEDVDFVMKGGMVYKDK